MASICSATVALLGHVDGLAPEAFRLRQPLGDQVAHDDTRGAQQVAGCRGREADRSTAGNVNSGSRPHSGGNGAMIPGGENVRQAGQVADLLHGLCLVRKLQQIEIGVRHHDIFGLASNPSPHVDIAIRGARPCGIHTQTYSGRTFLAVPAAPAGDVKRDRNEISDLDEFNVASGLKNLSGDFVPEDQSLRRRGAAADHMLVAAANIGGNDLQNHSVLALSFSQRQFGKVDGLHLDLARSHVRYSTIARHRFSSLNDVYPWCLRFLWLMRSYGATQPYQ